MKRLEAEIHLAGERARAAATEKQKMQFVLETAVRRLHILESKREDSVIAEILGWNKEGTLPLDQIEKMLANLAAVSPMDPKARASTAATAAPKIKVVFNSDKLLPVFDAKVEAQLEEHKFQLALEEARQKQRARKERFKKALKMAERDMLHHTGTWKVNYVRGNAIKNRNYCSFCFVCFFFSYLLFRFFFFTFFLLIFSFHYFFPCYLIY